MGGFFGTVSKTSCVTDLFYGTDYNSHLGTNEEDSQHIVRKRFYTLHSQFGKYLFPNQV